jgi:hypothetical protein
MIGAGVELRRRRQPLSVGVPMSETLLLVDFENVGKIDLAAVPDGFVVALFFGAAQKSVPKEFLKAAVKLRGKCVHAMPVVL